MTINTELFKGDMTVTRALIDSSHRRWTYTHGVLAFHAEDNPTNAQLKEIVEDFENFMFAGKTSDTYNITWVRHGDKGNTEVHFVIPRTDLETGQDLNIAPPGHEKDWAAWTAWINHRYGFVDPFTQPRKVTREIYREHPDRAATREQINIWVETQVARGLIRDRDHLIKALGKAGEITRVNDKFISLKTTAAEKAFRLKGAIFEVGFDFSTGNTAPRPGTGPRPSPSEIQHNRDVAYEERRNFFKKLRARSRKLRAEARDKKAQDEVEWVEDVEWLVDTSHEAETYSERPVESPDSATSGGDADQGPATRSEQTQARSGANPGASHQQSDHGAEHVTHSGPVADAFNRIRRRERELAGRAQAAGRTVRRHRSLIDSIVRLGERAGKAIERIGRALREFGRTRVNASAPASEPGRISRWWASLGKLKPRKATDALQELPAPDPEALRLEARADQVRKAMTSEIQRLEAEIAVTENNNALFYLRGQLESARLDYDDALAMARQSILEDDKRAEYEAYRVRKEKEHAEWVAGGGPERLAAAREEHEREQQKPVSKPASTPALQLLSEPDRRQNEKPVARPAPKGPGSSGPS
ncbi:relaxase/mobilization nuclease domain-containing protein [Roseovarius dicentrarchi]|uniref:relaxase/mobilization nuclease domain-containing protein n=1 Tax=Roseovarius dicentrarchi TaxID=2250573 RepID=UPI0013966B2F|nr:relaxase/mobilization nuclease domain-containing protein [Roseovarius dicentrarchi]